MNINVPISKEQLLKVVYVYCYSRLKTLWYLEKSRSNIVVYYASRCCLSIKLIAVMAGAVVTQLPPPPPPHTTTSRYPLSSPPFHTQTHSLMLMYDEIFRCTYWYFIVGDVNKNNFNKIDMICLFINKASCSYENMLE